MQKVQSSAVIQDCEWVAAHSLKLVGHTSDMRTYAEVWPRCVFNYNAAVGLIGQASKTLIRQQQRQLTKEKDSGNWTFSYGSGVDQQICNYSKRNKKVVSKKVASEIWIGIMSVLALVLFIFLFRKVRAGRLW